MFVDFSKAFDSILREKMEQVLLAYGCPKETVNDIMMLYKDMKAMVCSPNSDIDFFDIVSGFLRRDIYWLAQSARAEEYTDCISTEG